MEEPQETEGEQPQQSWKSIAGYHIPDLKYKRQDFRKSTFYSKPPVLKRTHLDETYIEEIREKLLFAPWMSFWRDVNLSNSGCISLQTNLLAECGNSARDYFNKLKKKTFAPLKKIAVLNKDYTPKPIDKNAALYFLGEPISIFGECKLTDSDKNEMNSEKFISNSENVTPSKISKRTISLLEYRGKKETSNPKQVNSCDSESRVTEKEVQKKIKSLVSNIVNFQHKKPTSSKEIEETDSKESEEVDPGDIETITHMSYNLKNNKAISTELPTEGIVNKKSAVSPSAYSKAEDKNQEKDCNMKALSSEQYSNRKQCGDSGLPNDEISHGKSYYNTFSKITPSSSKAIINEREIDGSNEKQRSGDGLPSDERTESIKEIVSYIQSNRSSKSDNTQTTKQNNGKGNQINDLSYRNQASSESLTKGISGKEKGVLSFKYNANLKCGDGKTDCTNNTITSPESNDHNLNQKQVGESSSNEKFYYSNSQNKCNDVNLRRTDQASYITRNAEEPLTVDKRQTRDPRLYKRLSRSLNDRNQLNPLISLPAALMKDNEKNSLSNEDCSEHLNSLFEHETSNINTEKRKGKKHSKNLKNTIPHTTKKASLEGDSFETSLRNCDPLRNETCPDHISKESSGKHERKHRQKLCKNITPHTTKQITSNDQYFSVLSKEKEEKLRQFKELKGIIDQDYRMPVGDENIDYRIPDGVVLNENNAQNENNDSEEDLIDSCNSTFQRDFSSDELGQEIESNCNSSDENNSAEDPSLNVASSVEMFEWLRTRYEEIDKILNLKTAYRKKVFNSSTSKDTNQENKTEGDRNIAMCKNNVEKDTDGNDDDVIVIENEDIVIIENAEDTAINKNGIYAAMNNVDAECCRTKNFCCSKAIVCCPCHGDYNHIIKAERDKNHEQRRYKKDSYSKKRMRLVQGSQSTSTLNLETETNGIGIHKIKIKHEKCVTEDRNQYLRHTLKSREELSSNATFPCSHKNIPFESSRTQQKRIIEEIIISDESSNDEESEQNGKMVKTFSSSKEDMMCFSSARSSNKRKKCPTSEEDARNSKKVKLREPVPLDPVVHQTVSSQASVSSVTQESAPTVSFGSDTLKIIPSPNSPFFLSVSLRNDFKI